MSKRVDLTLGERLGLGFAAMMVGLGLFTSAVLYFGAQSARAQRAYLEDITPLYAQAEALERSMLYIAIGMRDLMLYSQTTTPEQLRHRLATVRSELARLAALPGPPAGARLLPQIEARVNAYADEASAALAPEIAPAQRLAHAYLLGQLREAALADIRSYRTVLQRESEAAAATMTLAREHVTTGSLILVALAAIFGLASAWLMTRSVSRPLRELTDVSGALGRGDWQPALDLAARIAPGEATRAATRSETGRLAQAFATAAIQLQAREQQLRAQAGKIQAQNEELRSQREELRAQAEALAEVDERKNHFLAVLAHELRNPMAPLTTSLEILRRSPAESDEALQAQEVIGRQTRQLVRLIDDLLDITRISRGKLRLEREPIDLVEVARACADDQAPILAGRSLAFDMELPPGPLRVHGDRARLAQVIGNLIHNAAKFTDAGGHIRLRLREDRAAGQAVLEIVDSGVGMDAGLMARLFQPFSQGATDLARSNAGLGLGLALVKSLVTMHEGTVEAQSDGPGKGARFIVRLPLIPADRAGGAVAAPSPARLRVVKRAASPSAKVAAADAPRRWRVLVIDDYVDAAMGLRTLLRLDGHEVEVAASGAEGLEKARAFEPHLIFCDIGLPVLNGYEVARHLRAEQGARPLLLIALTGYTSEADQARCMEAGFDRHFAKPLDPARLAGIFEELARLHP